MTAGSLVAICALRMLRHRVLRHRVLMTDMPHMGMHMGMHMGVHNMGMPH
jgi:hypothetical protein